MTKQMDLFNSVSMEYMIVFVDLTKWEERTKMTCAALSENQFFGYLNTGVHYEVLTNISPAMTGQDLLHSLDMGLIDAIVFVGGSDKQTRVIAEFEVRANSFLHCLDQKSLVKRDLQLGEIGSLNFPHKFISS